MESEAMKRNIQKLPGWIPIAIITLLNTFWLFWGMGEAYYEGWGVPDTPWFLFLSIGAGAMLLSTIAVLRPYIGGGILATAGLAFSVWWLLPGIQNGFYSLSSVLEQLFLSAGFSLLGVLIILGG